MLPHSAQLPTSGVAGLPSQPTYYAKTVPWGPAARLVLRSHFDNDRVTDADDAGQHSRSVNPGACPPGSADHLEQARTWQAAGRIDVDDDASRVPAVHPHDGSPDPDGGSDPLIRARTPTGDPRPDQPRKCPCWREPPPPSTSPGNARARSRYPPAHGSGRPRVLPPSASSEAPFAETAPERGGQGPSQRLSSGTSRISCTSRISAARPHQIRPAAPALPRGGEARRLWTRRSQARLPPGSRGHRNASANSAAGRLAAAQQPGEAGPVDVAAGDDRDRRLRACQLDRCRVAEGARALGHDLVPEGQLGHARA